MSIFGLHKNGKYETRQRPKPGLVNKADGGFRTPSSNARRGMEAWTILHPVGIDLMLSESRTAADDSMVHGA